MAGTLQVVDPGVEFSENMHFSPQTLMLFLAAWEAILDEIPLVWTLISHPPAKEHWTFWPAPTAWVWVRVTLCCGHMTVFWLVLLKLISGADAAENGIPYGKLAVMELP